MRYLLISDIHSNLEALEASLEAAEQLEPYQLMCLGDLVGYGADPTSCIDTIGNRANLILAGNHDLAVAGVIPFDEFNPIARHAIEWTRKALTPEDSELLICSKMDFTPSSTSRCARCCCTSARRSINSDFVIGPYDPVFVFIHVSGKNGRFCMNRPFPGLIILIELCFEQLTQ